MHRSNSFGASVEFAEYREYVAGDPIQRIDWSVYGRTDRYMIREAHEEVSARTYVLLDVSESMAYRQEGPMTKLDYASYLAAGMMFIMVSQGDSAALVTFDSEIRTYDPPVSNPTGLKPLLERLEETDPTRPGNIEAALHNVADLINGRGLIILISDLLQEPESVLRGLHHLHHQGKDVTLFHVLDPAELTLHINGLADLTELETGEKLTVDLDEIRESYQIEMNKYLDEIRRGCMSLKTDYILTNTKQQPHETLRKRTESF